jgi:hypothetical protein
MPHDLDRPGLRIVSRAPDSVVLLNLHTALISLHGTLEELLERAEERFGQVTPELMEWAYAH